jgi:hypothetical protein
MRSDQSGDDAVNTPESPPTDRSLIWFIGFIAAMLPGMIDIIVSWDSPYMVLIAGVWGLIVAFVITKAKLV